MHRKISDTDFPAGIDKGGFDIGYALAFLVSEDPSRIRTLLGSVSCAIENGLSRRLVKRNLPPFSALCVPRLKPDQVMGAINTAPL